MGNLSSLGDLLTNIAGLSDVTVEKEEGLSPTGHLKSIFTGGEIEVDGSVSKINGFVNVFINGHAVGLSNKLNDFEGLAVRMGTYEATLAKLTAALSGKVKPAAGPAPPVYVPAPEWKGD